MNVWLWHVHGSWTTSFVQGPHQYYVPVVPGRGPEGRGRAQTWEWPDSVHEVRADDAPDLPVDVVVLYVEHNAPQGRIAELRHPVADRTDVVVAHVTHFNDLFWDSGRAPTTVVEHGVVDPGFRYSGDVARTAVVVNEPCRRGRVVGTDLLDRFRAVGPLDVYGMETEPVGGRGDVPQDALHAELARRRVYLHPFRWTSLGLSLVEAMLLGMPVVALDTTAVREAVPEGAGVVSTRVDALQAALRSYLADADAARTAGAVGRAHASRAFALDRFLDDWNRLLAEVVR